MQYIELLSPARDADTGIAAVNCGADAVYIGGEKFGARKEAANNIDQIEKLIKYSHLFKAKVYLTLNTILTDRELEDALLIIMQAWNAGIDGLIIQDLGLLECNLPPVPLIASTQTDNRSVEKVQFFEKCGFKRVILARELTIPEIKQIRNECNIELESFVHGSLCVSYSGQCWASAAVTGRSANRGECAQLCRSAYDLEDSTGRKILNNKYLLSMKDLNLYSYLQNLIDAGIRSFKIEGRLKDINYVKNITAFYRLKLDSIFEKSSTFKRLSSGKSFFNFTPEPSKTFNRGYTSYFINGRQSNLSSFLTQKSIGKHIGKVISSKNGILNLVLSDEISCGDGICYFNNNEELNGFMVNKVVENKITPNIELDLEAGTSLYRNYDQKFQKQLDDQEIQRKLSLHATFKEVEGGFHFTVEDEDHFVAEKLLVIKKEKAINPGKAEILVRRQLSKTGNTPFQIDNIEIDWSSAYHFPISILNELRREVLTDLLISRKRGYKRTESRKRDLDAAYYLDRLDYTANILNSKAELFYRRHGVKFIEPAFESGNTKRISLLMKTKYCIKFELGRCPKKQVPEENGEGKLPLYLLDMHHRYRLEFDCTICEMNVFLEEQHIAKH